MCLFFDETLFKSWRVEGGEVYTLKCLSRLEVCTHINNWVFFFNLSPLEILVSKNAVFISDTSVVNCTVCLFNELRYIFLFCLVQSKNMSSAHCFHTSGWNPLWIIGFLFLLNTTAFFVSTGTAELYIWTGSFFERSTGTISLSDCSSSGVGMRGLLM